MGLGRPALVLVVAATRGHALCWTAEQPNCDYALATLATKPTLRELELFLRTLHRFDATRKVYVGTDSVASNWTRQQQIHAVVDTPCLARYEAFSRNWMKRQRWGELTVWTHLQLEKTTVMARALDDGWSGVLYADCDVVWLAPLPPVGPGVLGVSPCLCAPRVEARYGKYNGGHVFARSREVLAVWRNATRRSRYFEQAALETVRTVFKESAFDLDRRANVEWLNLLGSHSFDRRDHTMNLTVDDDGQVWWLGDRLLSIHAHVVPSSNQPNFQLSAVARITAVLQRSLILDDLCATHHLLCASRAPCPVAAFRGRSRTVHIASFRAGHGDPASNYYHFFFGLLVPFLNWLETSRPLQGDAFLLNEHGVKHKFLPQLMRLAGREKCVQVGVVGASTHNGSDATARHVTLSNDLDWSILEGPSPRRVRLPEWGLDWHLYGCGFFSIEARRELAQRVDVASRTMLRACTCAPEPMAPSKPRLLFVRRRPNPHNTHQNRSLSNFDALVAHLHAQSWSSAIEFRVVDFADLTLCEQACEAHQSAVLVAQHGAGLANAAYLRDRGRAAVVEICPKSMWYKSIFQCLAGLRGAHYGRIQQTDIHGPVDVAAVADAVATVLELLGSPVDEKNRYPPQGGHSCFAKAFCRKVCGKHPDWHPPIVCVT